MTDTARDTLERPEAPGPRAKTLRIALGPGASALIQMAAALMWRSPDERDERDDRYERAPAIRLSPAGFCSPCVPALPALAYAGRRTAPSYASRKSSFLK